MTADLHDDHPDLRARLALPGSDAWRACEIFQYQEYVRLGWIPENNSRIVKDYEQWSTGRVAFHYLAAADGTILGTVRTILGPVAELPVGKHHPNMVAAVGADPVVEFASLVVSPDLRGAHSGEHLYASSGAWTVAVGGEALVGMVDDWLFEVLRDVYKIPFIAAGPPISYLGSRPRPIITETVSAVQAVRANNPPLSNLFEFYLRAYAANAAGCGKSPSSSASARVGRGSRS